MTANLLKTQSLQWTNSSTEVILRSERFSRLNDKYCMSLLQIFKVGSLLQFSVPMHILKCVRVPSNCQHKFYTLHQHAVNAGTKTAAKDFESISWSFRDYFFLLLFLTWIKYHDLAIIQVTTHINTNYCTYLLACTANGKIVRK